MRKIEEILAKTNIENILKKEIPEIEKLRRLKETEVRLSGIEIGEREEWKRKPKLTYNLYVGADIMADPRDYLNENGFKEYSYFELVWGNNFKKLSLRKEDMNAEINLQFYPIKYKHSAQ